MENFGIKNTKIIFRQDSINNIELLKSDILNEIQNKNNLNTQESQQIQLLQAELAKYKFDNLQYTKEARAAFPGINNISISLHQFYGKSDSAYQLPVAIFSTTSGSIDIGHFNSWLKNRLNVDSILIFELKETKLK